jgi:hypothetical protein
VSLSSSLRTICPPLPRAGGLALAFPNDPAV